MIMYATRKQRESIAPTRVSGHFELIYIGLSNLANTRQSLNLGEYGHNTSKRILEAADRATSTRPLVPSTDFRYSPPTGLRPLMTALHLGRLANKDLFLLFLLELPEYAGISTVGWAKPRLFNGWKKVLSNCLMIAQYL